MKSVNRQFGKLVTKGEGNTAKVSVLLNDYENADKTLTKVSYPACLPCANLAN
jgi:hypothetical protein